MTRNPSCLLTHNVFPKMRRSRNPPDDLPHSPDEHDPPDGNPQQHRVDSQDFTHFLISHAARMTDGISDHGCSIRQSEIVQ